MIDLGTVDTFINFTPKAKREIKRQLELNNVPDEGVRVIVVLDRYAGFVFDLEFGLPDIDDHFSIIDDIKVFTKKTFLQYIKGMRIDYNHDIPSFVFHNDEPSYNCVPGSKFECPSCDLWKNKDAKSEAPEFSSLKD